MNEQIPELKFEQMDDEQGTLILLEQDSGGNIDRLALHPIHLRYLAEKCGLVPTSNPDGAKTIATLQRRLRLLQSRIEHLSKWLDTSERGRAGMDYGIAYAEATAAMAAEFCADMGEQA
ncbi:hypothetical protein EGT07_18175 [Herbaspirillum sp. HC18]|nr:hypothetical protein EGT07_18175 [Herbaspirillum sp. HC18]